MPYIDVKLYEGRLDPDSTQKLIESLTQAVIDVYGEAIRDQTWIVLQEVPPARWGIGGRPGVSSPSGQTTGSG
jgi:4-oxalocrotonate tautomerase